MTNDKQRERLVELIQGANLEIEKYLHKIMGEVFAKEVRPIQKEDVDWEKVNEIEAEYLIANGVIVPPCKVGEVVYEVIPKGDLIRSLNVVGFHLGRFPDLRGHKRKEYLVCYSAYSLTHLDIDKFGKTVFLTKEEAEQALVNYESSKNDIRGGDM